MKKQFKLGVIGNNLISQTLIKGAVLSDFLNRKRIIVSGVDDKSANENVELGVAVINDNKYVFENSEFLLIAVTAESFKKLSESVGGISQSKIISLSEGIKKGQIKNIFGTSSVKIARAVANLPSKIGSGAVGLDMSDFDSSADDLEFISKLFNCIGTVLSVDESKLDVVTALSVNGSAYVFMFIDSLIDAGVKHGLKRGEAEILAAQTMLGATELMQREECSTSKLTMQICNNDNSALKAVKVLENNKFREIIGEAVNESVNYLKESDRQ